MWWIVLGCALAALVILGLAVRSVLRRLPGLRRAVRRLRERESQARTLQESAQVLQDRAAVLGRQAESAQRRIARLTVRRGG
jgi:hypothetical protein